MAPAVAAALTRLGFGTSHMGNCGELVANGIKRHYRHIDTAWKYHTKKGRGRRHTRLRRATQRDISWHQGFARDSARRRFRAHKGVSIAQVVLRWHLQQPSVIPIPRSSNPGRQAENLDLFDRTLIITYLQRRHNTRSNFYRPPNHHTTGKYVSTLADSFFSA